MEDLSCILEMHIDGNWREAAVLELTGEPARGVEASTYLAYLPEHALAYWGRTDAAALSVNLPVDLVAAAGASWPPFLVDLLPQGYGRIELLKQLERDLAAGPAADWALLRAGAGNPIGNIRVKQAHDWVSARTGAARRGFTIDEVASRADDFNEYLAQHGLFLAGSSGVQGEWPKILLTQARDGLFYLDHSVADADALAHFIVKFGRGEDQRLAAILRLEAPYMQLARGLGLDVHADLVLHGRALFIPRFDRAVQGERVIRHGQESIASLCGIAGFGALPSHNEVCRRLAAVVTEPFGAVLEYLKRDIANVALGNKDNHARNTALQRFPDGRVALTPLFDFAPMWLHPDGLARRIRWLQDDGGAPVWSSAITQACTAAKLDEETMRAGLRAMAGPMSTLAADGLALGIAPEFIAPLEKTIADVAAQLEAL